MTDEHRTRERPRGEAEDRSVFASPPAVDRRDAAVPSSTAAAPAVEDGRRRRWLVGGAVLGVVVVLAYVLGATIAADQAQQRARAEALRVAAETAFARLVVERAEEYEPPALEAGRTAALLRDDLEQHLVGTAPVGTGLTAAVEARATALLVIADRVEELVARPLPDPEPLVDPFVAREVLTALEQLRVEAAALVDEVRGTASPAVAWSTAVADLDAALAAHAAVVERRPDDPDPSVIADGWRSELGPLRALRRQGRATAEVPGLEAWGTAHAAYAGSTIAFVERAVPLLEGGELDEYNELFLATFSTDDPFGFQDAARAGAVEALADDPLLAVARLEERATIVLESLTMVERLLADGAAGVG